MSVSRLIGVQLVVFFCSSIPVVLLDNPSSPDLCFIIGFFCDLSVARNDSWMS